ncbi:MAG: polysaccharide deacetylase family protein [Candidatus Sphingomonas phytovorans]|nr:polysaccharide deacetylase family protein [Sphingomonas sp.]WEK02353.1 MAG: polysaccharide deacetylase family protein [Sphingomonas sp.]
MNGDAEMIALRALLTVVALVGVMLPIGGAVDAPRAVAKASALQKTIALSFDDIPRAPGAFYSREERTERLIAALRASGVTQTAFFVNPGRVGAKDGSLDLIEAYAAAGHVLADHSFSHRSLAAVPAAAFLADVDQAEAWLKHQPGYRPWFRFPGLNQGGADRAKRRAVLDGLKARGLLVGAVTIDGSDWYLERLTLEAARAGKPIDEDALHDLYIETMVQSAEFSDRLMRKTIGRSPAHMMLLHETDLAARYIGDLVEALRNNGWRIVTADAAYRDPIYHSEPNVPTSNGTLSEAMAWAKGIPGPRWYGRNDARIAGALFNERVMHQPPAIVALTDRHRQCRDRNRRPHRACPDVTAKAA